ncbi:MAG: hypothetical protein WBM83_15660 [Flavobacteriaceae bacterium]
MTNQYIEFKKQRELGDILSDTFAFIRNEFKPFVSTFFKIVGPYLFIMIIALGLYMYYIGNTFGLLMFNADSAPNIALILVVGAFYVVALVAVYTISQSTVLHYIKSYANGKGTTDFNTIKKDVYGSILNFIGQGFLVIISLIAGFFICFFPMIYLLVPLSLTFAIMVYNRLSVSDAYSYSFTLVKNEWWITFATLLVVGIVVYIASLAFALPTAIYNWIKMGIFSGAVDAEGVLDMFKDPIYILFNVIATVAQFLMNIISIVAGAFIYFNLNEKKNFTGTYERIESLGETL